MLLSLVNQFEKEILDKRDNQPTPIEPPRSVVKKKPNFLPMISREDIIPIEDNDLTPDLMSTPQLDPESLTQLSNVYEIAEKGMNKSRANESEDRPGKQSHLFTVSH